MISLRHVADFYILDRLHSLAKPKAEASMSHKDIAYLEKVENALARLVPLLANALFSYLYLACMGEARHAATSEAKTYFLTNFYGGDRTSAYSRALDYDPFKSLPYLVKLFKEQVWMKGYGGDPWGLIAEGALLYTKIPDGAFIDHAVDLQHNNGTAFSKVETKTVIGFDNTFHAWNHFLERKKNHDILDGFDYDIWLNSTTVSLLEKWKGIDPGGLDFHHIPNPEKLEWEFPEYGEKVVQLRRKITHGRTINKTSDNAITPSIIKKMLVAYVTSMLDIETKFVLSYGAPAYKQEVMHTLDEYLKKEIENILPAWKEADPDKNIEAIVSKQKAGLYKQIEKGGDALVQLLIYTL